MIADRRGRFFTRFGPLCSASGAYGWGVEGYAFHQPLKLLGYRWLDFVTPISKTVTVGGTAGNMPLQADGIKPKEWKPRCVAVNFWTGHAMNVVALSSRPFEYYLSLRTIWQPLKRPFIFSYMPITDDPLAETEEFVRVLRRYERELLADWGIQFNLSCPNRHLDLSGLAGKAHQLVEILAKLELPISAKLGVTAPAQLGLRVVEHPAVTALTFGNTIPHGDLRIDWDRHGWGESPLTKRGFDKPGALSGADCLPFTIDRILSVVDAGIKVDVFGGNGVYTPRAAKRVLDAGAAGIEYGMGGVVRTPWMVPTQQFVYDYTRKRQP